MPTYEEQMDKLIARQAELTKRIIKDQGELERLNAKMSVLQLAKVREALDMEEKEFFEMLTQHPEQLKFLLKRGVHRASPEVKSDSVPYTDSKSDGDGNPYQ